MIAPIVAVVLIAAVLFALIMRVTPNPPAHAAVGRGLALASAGRPGVTTPARRPAAAPAPVAWPAPAPRMPAWQDTSEIHKYARLARERQAAWRAQTASLDTVPFTAISEQGDK